MSRLLMGVMVPLVSGPALAAESSPPCSLTGEVIQWAADFCMFKLETDDEIPASECIDEQIKIAFTDDCAAKMHFKLALCGLFVTRDPSRGTIEQCMEDPNFMGRTVRDGGVGPRG